MGKYAILCNEQHPFREPRENLGQGKNRNDLASLVYFYNLRIRNLHQKIEMTPLKLNINPKVAEVFNNYPEGFPEKLRYLRQLIITTAEEIGIPTLEETLKWGQPSYLAPKGSTVRLGWKKTNNHYAIYFKCTSKLVLTFKEIYGATFNYEKHRAIEFTLADEVPEQALKHCISMALQYHQIKHLPLLGAGVH